MSDRNPHLASANQKRAQKTKVWVLAITVCIFILAILFLWIINMRTLIGDAAKNDTDRGLIHIVEDDFSYIMDTIKENDKKREAAFAALSASSTTSNTTPSPTQVLIKQLAEQLSAHSTSSTISTTSVGVNSTTP